MGLRIPFSQIAEFRAGQSAAAQLAVDDLRDVFSRLDLGKPAAARDLLVQVAPAITTQWGTVSASAAAEWYGDMRSTLEVPGNYSPVVGDPARTVLVEKQVRFGAQHLWTDYPFQTLAFLTGVTIRYVLDGGRNTITENVKADPVAVGWQRIARPGACKFCRFLMANGAVYKTQHTATFAAHNDCQCVAVQSWDADAEEVPVRVYEASQRPYKKDPKQVARHRANLRDALAKFE